MGNRTGTRTRAGATPPRSLQELQSITIRTYTNGDVEAFWTRLDPRTRRLSSEQVLSTDALPVGEHPYADLLVKAAIQHADEVYAQLPLW